MTKKASYEYKFPSIKGIQASQEYYIAMCPLRLIPKIFLFDEEELVPELRAQRVLNKSRIPDISNYILDNPKSYVFSALSASIDGDLRFIPAEGVADDDAVGTLHIPMSATFIINDGQHRRAAIEEAIKEKPELADETIAIVFFKDKGLKKSQQMFADLNRYAVKPSKSLGVLYDHKDPTAEITRNVVKDSNVFKNLVEFEKTTLAPRSRRLFTMSSIHQANKLLLSSQDSEDIAKLSLIATEFWDELDQYIPEWYAMRSNKASSGEIRQDFIHSHSVALSAFGRFGSTLLKDKNWKTKLANIESIDWRRTNSALWEGRAMRDGKISKAHDCILLTSIFLKEKAGLSLTPEEESKENKFKEERNIKNG